MLKVIESIKSIGLEETVFKFKLILKDYNHKILLKYNQIESDMSLPEVCECRGLILEKDTWKVMNMSFYKFFNAAESHAAKIDWNTAHILEKLDGSLIQVYWDWREEKWFAGTSGMAEGEGEVNNKVGTSFSELFWKTINGKYPKFRLEYLDKKCCYAFELTTPYNIVVKPHGESSATLLTARNIETLKEASRIELIEASKALHLPCVKAYDINATNAGHLIKTFEGMPFTDEGYIVVDANWNRIKIKNPAYVAVHGLKNRTAEYRIVEIIKSNEIEEFGAVFPERREEVFKLRESYENIEKKLIETWFELKGFLPRNITKEEQKKFALKVFELSSKNKLNDHTGLFFGLKDGKLENIKEYMINLDNKKLYTMLETKY
jgi:hypothetical protein